MPLSQGQILNNRYRTVKLLGQGGFGAVYRAWDVTLDRPCALKESLMPGEEAQRQFLREARILAKLSHPNLPRVNDYFTIPEQGQYLVMDYVEGQDLEALRAQAGGRLPEAQALGWISQVCEALEYLHHQSPPVIHRDIKPANIKVTPDNRAMLVDFGIAKTYDPRVKTTLGARAVTPGYSPIEQYGQGTTDNRSDIYALGATLYSLLTGIEPPEAPTRAVQDMLVAPGRANAAIEPATESAILKALQMNPTQRFQEVGEFRARIRRQPAAAREQRPIVTQITPPEQAPPSAAAKPGLQATMGVPVPAAKRRFPWIWVGIGAGVLVVGTLLIVLGVLAMQGMGDSRLTQTAQARSTQTAAALAVLLPQAPTPSSATNTPAPNITSMPSDTPEPIDETAVPSSCDQVSFVTDVTIPDDTEIPAGMSFVKTWRLRNTGSCTWTSDYDLVFDSGEAMSGPDAVPLTSGTVPPGATVDVSVTLTAPVTPGTYRGHWILRNAAGETFGIGAQADISIWLQIRSVEADAGSISPVATQVSTVDGMVQSYIPGGTFLMGSESGYPQEQPVHNVTLDAFWIDQFEVTNSMYAVCVADRVCNPPRYSSSSTRDPYYGEAAYADFPVIYVDWHSAEAYCSWAGRRLPTEAEWEYAALGGLSQAQYPWGDEPPNCTLGSQNGAQFDQCSPQDTIAVGSFAPNGYGLYDMAGNVWEWVADIYGYYPDMDQENPTGPDTGRFRVLRGGAWGGPWGGDESSIRVALRYWYDPESTYINLGFRCANSVSSGEGSAPSGTIEYVVQEGDTLLSIATYYGTDVAILVALNPSLADSNTLYVGQVILIPTPVATESP